MNFYLFRTTNQSFPICSEASFGSWYWRKLGRRYTPAIWGFLLEMSNKFYMISQERQLNSSNWKTKTTSINKLSGNTFWKLPKNSTQCVPRRMQGLMRKWAKLASFRVMPIPSSMPRFWYFKEKKWSFCSCEIRGGESRNWAHGETETRIGRRCHLSRRKGWDIFRLWTMEYFTFNLKISSESIEL